MNYTDYILNRNKIFDFFSKNVSVWDNEFIMGKFNLVSASLYNYLPAIPPGQHEKIFKDILLHQQLSILEQAVPEILNNVSFNGLTDDVLNMLKHQPVILCTFHTGSYRVIHHFLLKSKINYSLVVAKTVLDTQGKDYKNLHEGLYANEAAMFNIIDAENPRSFMQMLREIKNGKVLVFYIDGNTGAEIKNDEKNNLCDIEFLEQRIFARKGIAYLSHITNTPVLTVGCYRKTFDDIRLVFHDLIQPDSKIDREEFGVYATQRMYNYIMPVIRKYPEQWEGWLYLYKSMNLVNKPNSNDKPAPVMVNSKTDKLKFNAIDFGICRIDNGTYIFEKDNFSFFPVEEDVYKTLKKAITNKILRTELSEEVFYQLYQNKVLI